LHDIWVPNSRHERRFPNEARSDRGLLEREQLDRDRGAGFAIDGGEHLPNGTAPQATGHLVAPKRDGSDRKTHHSYPTAISSFSAAGCVVFPSSAPSDTKKQAPP
jgi:hypothetical protein